MTPDPSTLPTRATREDRDEWALVEALRRGDETAFLALVDRHHRSMVRVARLYAGTEAAAEDVVQEAWLGVMRGIGKFEGRSSVKSWIFQIVVHRAKTRGQRESRTLPLSALEPGEDERGPAVDPDRFQPATGTYPDNWARPPEPWTDDRLASAQAAARVRAEIERLPAGQRAVITMRDVEGLDSEEVCAVLGISEGNQRVLLHRARSRVRAALERELSGGAP